MVAFLQDVGNWLRMVTKSPCLTVAAKRGFEWLLVTCLVTGTLWAANDSFVGKWKLNPAKSKFADQVKVEVAGPNRYAITFVEADIPRGVTDTVVANGKDQPAVFGTTLSLTKGKPNTWKVVRKSHGHMLLMAIWNLSEDGNTLSDAFTAYQPNGSTSTTHYVYTRTAGRSGFVGTWQSKSEKVESGFEIQIRPYQGDGLSFINPDVNQSQNVKFDGRDYPDAGANVRPLTVSSGRRMNEHTVELTDKVKGKVIDTQQFELSPGSEALTVTVRHRGQSAPNILVFERE